MNNIIRSVYTRETRPADDDCAAFLDHKKSICARPLRAATCILWENNKKMCMNRDQRGKTDLLLLLLIFIKHAAACVYNTRTFQYINIGDLSCYRYDIIYFDIYDDVPLARVHDTPCVQKRDDFTTLTPIMLQLPIDTSVLGGTRYEFGCEVGWVNRVRKSRKYSRIRRRSRIIRKRPTAAIKHGLFGARRVVSERNDCCGREYNNIVCRAPRE